MALENTTGGLNEKQKQALGRIHQMANDALRKHAYGLVGSGDSDKAHDLVQETYTALQGRIDENGVLRDKNGHEVINCLAYAKTTLKNLYKAWNDDEQRYSSLDASSDMETNTGCRPLLQRIEREIVHTFFTTDYVSGRITSSLTFANLMTKLEPEMRSIFIQRVLQERSWEDIAKDSNCSIGYCKYMVKMAKAKLRFIWKRELDRNH